MPFSDHSRIDHLIFGAPSLAMGTALIYEQLGIHPTAGGQHPDYGTHNALFRIGNGTYFEVIAPDPGLAHRNPRLWMGLDKLQTPGLIWWAAKSRDIPADRQRARSAGWDPGLPMPGTRKTADGTTLRWQLTDPFHPQEGGVLPFLIDWQDSPHPSDQMPPVDCVLTELQILHPQPTRIQPYLRAIDLPFPVQEHPDPALRATFVIKGKVVTL